MARTKRRPLFGEHSASGLFDLGHCVQVRPQELESRAGALEHAAEHRVAAEGADDLALLPARRLGQTAPARIRAAPLAALDPAVVAQRRIGRHHGRPTDAQVLRQHALRRQPLAARDIRALDREPQRSGQSQIERADLGPCLPVPQPRLHRGHDPPPSSPLWTVWHLILVHWTLQFNGQWVTGCTLDRFWTAPDRRLTCHCLASPTSAASSGPTRALGSACSPTASTTGPAPSAACAGTGTRKRNSSMSSGRSTTSGAFSSPRGSCACGSTSRRRSCSSKSPPCYAPRVC